MAMLFTSFATSAVLNDGLHFWSKLFPNSKFHKGFMSITLVATTATTASATATIASSTMATPTATAAAAVSIFSSGRMCQSFSFVQLGLCHGTLGDSLLCAVIINS
jgi:hypothetical protein